MRSPAAKIFASCAILVFAWCVSVECAEAAVFRDRAAFNAASQNLNTIDFEAAAAPDLSDIDGVVFQSIGGQSIATGQNGTKVLVVNSVGEITRVIIFLPPGTTAVGCDQYARPMIVTIPTGESVTMDQSDTSTFVGFVSDQPIQTLTVFFDFPEPTPTAFVDNLSYGQRRAGNEPPVPQLLVTAVAARAAALDSVTNFSEMFRVTSSHNFATDGHTRINLFVAGVALTAADLPFVQAKAEDQAQHVFDLAVEGTARVKNLSWMSQVTVRVPDALTGAGDVNISVTVRGAVSNKAQVRIE